MRNFQDTIEIRKQSFIRAFSMSTALPFHNLTSTPYVTARIVAQIICKIISTIIVVGNIRLITRYLYKSILAQTFWDSLFNVLYYHFGIEEITFWKQNIQPLNKTLLIPGKLPITNGSFM